MTRNRFQLITRFMRFDSKDTRLERKQWDKMAPIRDIHDRFAAVCRASYIPDSQLCVDEQFVVYRGRCPFKIYIPSKPGKCGLKVWGCCECDVNRAYVCNLELYTGKQGRTPEVDLATKVVLQMIEPWNGSGRGCTADYSFTPFTLADAQLTRNITYCGTYRIGDFSHWRFWTPNKEVYIQFIVISSAKRRWYRTFPNVGRMSFSCPRSIIMVKYMMNAKIKSRI